ncbi:YkgJ family cysteine cluster protein [Methanoregula sp.]|uniref:YkgJ family cysteine cluster protein n=1 Tax=Methanoregula sp. TaxID=2052170 RepID=UPI003C73F074
MAKFVCNGCGKCCAGYGSFIRIERQLNDRDYYCRYGLTGDLFPVHADADYAGEIADRYTDGPGIAREGKKPCPFLCRNRSGEGFACGIYATRPPVCREFRCYRMLVYNREGQLVGRVIGAGGISTSDEYLAQVWKEQIAGLPHTHPPGTNDPIWVKKVTAILAEHGFQGDPAE